MTVQTMLRPPLELFTMIVELELQRHDDNPERGPLGWRRATAESLYNHLKEERAEVDAIMRGDVEINDPMDLVSELAHEAAMCMMIADVTYLAQLEAQNFPNGVRVRGAYEIGSALDRLHGIYYHQWGVTVPAGQQLDWLQGQIAALCWATDHCSQAQEFESQLAGLREAEELTDIGEVTIALDAPPVHIACACCGGPGDYFVCQMCEDCECEPGKPQHAARRPQSAKAAADSEPEKLV